MKRRLAIAGGLIVGLLLWAALVAYSDVQAEDWIRLLNRLSWPWVAALAVIVGSLWWVGSRKWSVWAKALHGTAGEEPARGFYMRHYAWQAWAGQFMPPSLAIIGGRSWATHRDVGWRAGAASGLYDQIMEFLMMAAILPAAALILLLHAGAIVWIPAALGGLLVAGAVIRFLGARFAPKLGPFLVPLCAWSAARSVLSISSIVVGVYALGFNMAPSAVVATCPVVSVLTVLPLTPGNLGVAEWGWTGVLAFAGTNKLDAALFAMSFRLLMFAVQTVLIAVGQLAFVIQGREKKTERS